MSVSRYGRGVAAKQIRLEVTLDVEHAAKLARLAERTQVREEALARSLLSRALDAADPDARHIADLLDAIPAAYGRALLARHKRGRDGRSRSATSR